MKNIKFLAVALFACISMYATAAVTAKVNIKVQGTLSDEILIVQDDAAAANFADQNNASKIMNTANSWCLNIYALNGTTKLGAVVNPSINGLKLEFQSSSKEGSYTMSFSDVVGSITLTNADTSFVIDANKSYAFTCTPGATVAYTLSVPQNVYTRTVTSGDWGTICLPWESTKLEGAVFYNVIGEFDANQGVALEIATKLEAGYPYVFKANAAEVKVTYDPATEVQAVQYGDNDLYGSFTGCSVPKDMYIISSNLLYKTADASSTIAANRAYFDVESMDEYQALPGRKVVFMGTEATGLNVIKAEAGKVQKVMINGQMVIMKGDKMFNAQGAAL